MINSLVFFNHIPKTAGQYLINILRDEFKDKFYWAVHGSSLDLEEITSGKYLCVASHVLNSANEVLAQRLEIHKRRMFESSLTNGTTSVFVK